MNIMIMHKSSPEHEVEQPPTQELIANVGKLVQAAMQNGTFLDGAGLRSSKRRARVSVRGGERKVAFGPFQGGEHELPSAIALLKVRTMDEAVDWGARFAEATEAEVEVGPVTEPWHLGVAPEPTGDVPLRVLLLVKGRDTDSAPEQAGFARASDEARKADVLVNTHSLFPSRQASRVVGPSGARRVIDGPYSESKELISGFVAMTFASREEASAFALQYADLVGTPEVDVRELR